LIPSGLSLFLLYDVFGLASIPTMIARNTSTHMILATGAGYHGLFHVKSCVATFTLQRTMKSAQIGKVSLSLGRRLNHFQTGENNRQIMNRLSDFFDKIL